MSRFFNGTTDIMNQTASPIPAYGMTFACWFNKTSLTPTGVLCELDVGGGNGVNAIYILSGSGPMYTISGDTSGGAAQAEISGPSAGVWTHFTGTYRSNALRTSYKNGIAGAANTAGITLPSFTRVQIGRIWDGALAECGMWNVELTDEEIGMLAKGFCPKLVRPASLKVYIPMIRDTQNIHIGPMSVTGTTVTEHPRIFY